MKRDFENKIKKLEERLKLQVFLNIMKETAKDLGMLKNDKISIENEEEYKKFKNELEKRLSKIIGKAAKGLVEE